MASDWKTRGGGGGDGGDSSDEDSEEKQDRKGHSYEVPTVKRALAFLLFQEKFSDVTFLVGRGKARIPAHRFVLAAQSPIFEAMLYDPFAGEEAAAAAAGAGAGAGAGDEKEVKGAKAAGGATPIGVTSAPLVVTIPDVETETFRQMLSCVYTNKTKLNPRLVGDCLALSRKYKIEVLRLECLNYMEQGMNTENACSLFETAPRVLGDEKFGLEFIEKNAEDVVSSHGFTQLSPSRVATIVRSPKLDVSEERLFKAVVSWGRAECRRNGMDTDERTMRGVLSDILPHIRFPIMKMSFIASDVNTSGLVTPDALLKLFTFVNQPEDERDPKDVDFPSHQRTPDLPRFRYSGDTSRQDGIVYWIATQEGRADWTNPHTAGVVTVSASSHCPSLNPSNQLYHVVEQRPTTSYGTNSLTDSWIQLDLKRYSVIPDYYRFANTRLSNCHPRTWRFQGQRAGGEWVTLSSHDTDRTLTDSNQVAAWAIEGVTEAFQIFRILQVGMTAEGGFGHLCCAGLEVWGRVRRLS